MAAMPLAEPARGTASMIVLKLAIPPLLIYCIMTDAIGVGPPWCAVAVPVSTIASVVTVSGPAIASRGTR